MGQILPSEEVPRGVSVCVSYLAQMTHQPRVCRWLAKARQSVCVPGVTHQQPRYEKCNHRSQSCTEHVQDVPDAGPAEDTLEERHPVKEKRQESLMVFTSLLSSSSCVHVTGFHLEMEEMAEGYDRSNSQSRSPPASSSPLSSPGHYSIQTQLPVESPLRPPWVNDQQMEEEEKAGDHQIRTSELPSCCFYEELFCSSQTSVSLAGALINSSGPQSDVVKRGYLGKLDRNHRRYFVLRAGSHTGPSRLEWYKSQEKFTAMEKSSGKAALFGSNKQGRTGSSRKGHTVALYAKDQTMVLVAEDQQEQDGWYQAVKKLMEEEQTEEDHGGTFDEDDDGYCTLPPAAFFKEVSKRSRPKNRDKLVNVRHRVVVPASRNTDVDISPQSFLEPHKPDRMEPDSTLSLASRLSPSRSQQSPEPGPGSYMEMKMEHCSVADCRVEGWELGEEEEVLGYMMMSPQVSYSSPEHPIDDYVTMASPRKHQWPPYSPPSSSTETSFNSSTSDLCSPVHQPHWPVASEQQSKVEADQSQMSSCQPVDDAGQEQKSVQQRRHLGLAGATSPLSAIHGSDLMPPFVISGPSYTRPAYENRSRSAVSNGHAETADGNLVIFETAL
ncbi:hypothetical protein INR49_000808 [Caranx melampygus]|nr:hypothetical protein INR49_000808 [Caranx melampygus]